MNSVFGRRARPLIAICIGVMIMLSGCSGNRPQASRPGGGLEDHRQQALFDRDTRNNEDTTLGVKPRWADEQSKQQESEAGSRSPLDMTNRHLSKTMRFEPQIAQRVMDLPGVQSAQVMVTEANAYVAVVLDGHNPDTEASPEVTGYQIHSKGGAGLFGGQRKPNRISWTETGGLAYSGATEIGKQVQGMLPKVLQNVYVSANPNFVQRVRFYAKEERERGSIGEYVNEFNTMVQYVFPNDTNTRR